MKFNKNVFYFFLAITAVILFSSISLYATTKTSSYFWTNPEDNSNRKLTTQNHSNSELYYQNQAISSELHGIFRTFMNHLAPVSSTGTSSTSPDSNNIRNNKSGGKITSAPEPLTLLLLGSGLMGVALYRRLKNK